MFSDSQTVLFISEASLDETPTFFGWPWFYRLFRIGANLSDPETSGHPKKGLKGSKIRNYYDSLVRDIGVYILVRERVVKLVEPPILDLATLVQVSVESKIFKNHSSAIIQSMALTLAVYTSLKRDISHDYLVYKIKKKINKNKLKFLFHRFFGSAFSGFMEL